MTHRGPAGNAYAAGRGWTRAMRTLTPALAVLALVLSGCSGGGGADPPEADFDDLGLEATESTGVIRGVVVDEAIRPVAGVRIEVRGPEGSARSAESNEQGAFGLDGLPPGEYFLTANKSGFRPTQAAASVVAGVAEPPVVRIVLAADPTTAPFVNAYVFEGFIDCSFRAVVIGFALCSALGTPNDRFQATYELEGTPDWWQTEMVWETTQTFGSDLSLDISCLSGDPCPDGQVTINRSEGLSPLYVTINRTQAEAFLLGNGQPVDVRVFAFGRSGTDVVDDEQVNQALNSTTGGAVECVEWPAVFASCIRFGGVGLIVQQAFTVYSHEFHRMTPPAGWRFSVDGSPPPPA